MRKSAILICGKACAGKTELAMALNNALPKSAIYPMAQGVKNLAYQMGWNGIKDMRGRKLLQDLGSVGRAYWEGVWVTDALKTYTEENAYIDYFISDDVRYQNEVDTVADFFDRVVLIRVSRPGGGLDGAPGRHGSEQWAESAKVNVEVKNSGSLTELRGFAKEIAHMILKGEAL